MKKYDETVQIKENKKINEKYFKLTFESKALSKNVEPGQFVQVQIQPTLDPFLRRPFSYYRVKGQTIEILYEVLGRGTGMLAQKKKGEVLKVMGPLGKPFCQGAPKGLKRVLVAGGVGVPPLIFLAEKLKMDYLLIGSKSKKEVLPPSELKNVKAKVMYSTNDGTYGKKGYVTALLKDVLKENDGKLFIQTCGPTVMMQAVMDLANQYGIQGEASLDKEMACGIGACLGCMVKTKEGWKPSCVEGPVFDFAELEHC